MDAVTGAAFGVEGVAALVLATLVFAAGTADLWGLVAGMLTPQNSNISMNERFGSQRWAGQGINLVRQEVWANIWCAVLAVSWPDEKCVITWPGPEVLLSRLSESVGLYLLAST
ncbi:MAG: hypothetical protein Q8M05_08070 [Rhodoferax sp.]|uniref:hypothetical protein n=2 Tax=Rhodoferax sp. TaxID=50421 RepID=UPI002718E394|nr:hypothetical protein [Rhodoferax sp.]MDO9143924.1 hypothetical protein [Rhodoferax sp.]MDP1529323.1 hypothetical protein [Rhodoferax sp.]MDP1945653.1 hypothetical protein [Rhodoferax sp.]MDP3190086.1 hypothetical protein [Rhodoferax sp.]MDP3865800.1 hypothetical protein [Rhodoferax sp.]